MLTILCYSVGVTACHHKASKSGWPNQPGKNVRPSIRTYVHPYVRTSTIRLNATTNQIVVFVKVDETFMMIWLSRSSEVRVKVRRWPQSSIGTIFFTFFWVVAHIFSNTGSTRVSRYQKKHSPTHSLTPILIINRPLWASSVYYIPWHPPCSICVLDSLFAPPLFRSSACVSWSVTPHFIFRTFVCMYVLHPVIVFFFQHVPIPSQPVLQ